MSTGSTYFDRKASPNTRPGISAIQQSSALPSSPHTPHTPQRTFSSTFSSPSASFRAEEDALVFEFGARHFSAGIGGETAPRCTLDFGPEEARRVGDYRKWQPNYKRRIRTRDTEEKWGSDYELWRMDLRTVDLGLVDDKIERVVREAYIDYLLLDQKPRRLMLILPPVMPHPLLDSILTTLFTNFQYSSITLLSTPVLSAVAAGLRSALVIDIGWAETVVTGIFEFREVHHGRSIRAMRATGYDLSGMLHKELEKARGRSVGAVSHTRRNDKYDSIGLEQSEEVVQKLLWCLSYDQSRKGEESMASQGPVSDPLMSIPSIVSPSETILQLRFSEFAKPVESALFASNRAVEDLDVHEQPIHVLAYQALLSLPSDVRAICMSRIVLTGGGSHIPGLKDRVIQELDALVRERDWDPVRGKAAETRRDRIKNAKNSRQNGTMSEGVQKSTESTEEPETKAEPVPAALADQEIDPIEDKLRREQAKITKPQVSGVVRGVESLGAWAGGSLLAGLKIKGIVEIEKDRFIQYGLAGANRDVEVSVVPQRQSFGPGMQRGASGDRSSWTLGAWA